MKTNLEIKEWLSKIQSSAAAKDGMNLCQDALRAHPESAELWNAYGEIMERQGHFHQAQIAFQKSVSIAPGNATVWNRLGILLQKNDRTAEAEASFLKAILVDPNFPNLRDDSCAVSDESLPLTKEEPGSGAPLKNNRNQLALMTFDTSVWISVVDEFLQEGEQERAGRILEKAYHTRPEDQLIGLKYATMLERLMREAEAYHVLKKLVEVCPDNAEAWQRLALIASAEGNEDAAVAALRKSVTLSPENQYKRLLALRLDVQGKTLEAIDVLSQASISDSTTLNLLGVLQHKSGRKQDAIISYEEGLKVGGEESFIYNNLGRLLEDMGDEDATWAFDRAVELDKSNAVAWNNFGVALRRQEFFSEAEKAFRLSISIAPHFKNPWLNLKDLSLAVSSVSAKVVSDFRFSDPIPSRWMQVGWNVFDKTHLSLQLKTLINQTERQPENPDKLHQLALCMLNLKLYQDAGDQLRRAIAIHEASAARWNLLGIICEKLGRLVDAIVCYERAIEYDNNYIGAIFNLKEAQLLYHEKSNVPELPSASLLSEFIL